MALTTTLDSGCSQTNGALHAPAVPYVESHAVCLSIYTYSAAIRPHVETDQYAVVDKVISSSCCLAASHLQSTE